jgi:hypothetical protein
LSDFHDIQRELDREDPFSAARPWREDPLPEGARPFAPRGDDGPPPQGRDRRQKIKAALRPFHAIRANLAARYVVKRWLDAGTFSVVYGEPNVGKTFFALDIAFHVAAGWDWHGSRVRGGPVVYLAAEGGRGVELRIEAFRRDRPDMARQIETEGTFHLLPITVDLCAPGDAEALVDALREIRPSLIVIDTLARSMGAGDENTAKDMGALVKNADFLRAETGAHVLVIHHSGKDTTKGARGSGALKGAIDHEIELTREGKVITAENKKERDGPSGLCFSYTLRPVTLGIDEDGDEVTSCVVARCDEVPKRAPKVTGQAKIALQAFGDALAVHGETRSGDMFPAGVKGVSLEHWRAFCDRHSLSSGNSDSAQRKAFFGAKNALQEKGIICVVDGFAWRAK